MPTMTDIRSIAANTRSANVLSGLPFEFVGNRPSIVRIYAVASAIGLNMDLLVGGESIVSDSEISGANRFPVRNEDLLAEHGGLPGERLFVAFRNTTGAAITSNLLVDVLPI